MRRLVVRGKFTFLIWLGRIWVDDLGLGRFSKYEGTKVSLRPPKKKTNTLCPRIRQDVDLVWEISSTARCLLLPKMATKAPRWIWRTLRQSPRSGRLVPRLGVGQGDQFRIGFGIVGFHKRRPLNLFPLPGVLFLLPLEVHTYPPMAQDLHFHGKTAE